MKLSNKNLLKTRIKDFSRENVSKTPKQPVPTSARLGDVSMNIIVGKMKSAHLNELV